MHTIYLPPEIKDTRRALTPVIVASLLRRFSNLTIIIDDRFNNSCFSKKDYKQAISEQPDDINKRLQFTNTENLISLTLNKPVLMLGVKEVCTKTLQKLPEGSTVAAFHRGFKMDEQDATRKKIATDRELTIIDYEQCKQDNRPVFSNGYLAGIASVLLAFQKTEDFDCKVGYEDCIKKIKDHIPEKNRQIIILGSGQSAKGAKKTLGELGFSHIKILSRKEINEQQSDNTLTIQADIVVNSTASGAPKPKLNLTNLQKNMLIIDI